MSVSVNRNGHRGERQKESKNQRISMRIDLEVLSPLDLIITTSTRDSEYVSV